MNAVLLPPGRAARVEGAEEWHGEGSGQGGDLGRCSAGGREQGLL